MKCEVSRFFFLTGFFGAVGCSPFLAYADVTDTITLICPGEEYGQLNLHDCYAAHVGGLSRRQTVIHSSREKHSAPLNPHTGNILDPTDPNISNSSAKLLSKPWARSIVTLPVSYRMTCAFPLIQSPP